MRIFPENEDDKKDIDELNAEQWMIEALKMNNCYCYWGNFEDYMSKKGDGWDSRIEHESWKSFGPWTLDEYNEVVNFYFEVNRNTKDCETCDHTGYNPETKKISDEFYSHTNNNGVHWDDKITQDEFEALKEYGRCRDFNTVYEVNKANSRESRKFLGSHDAINRWILIETRDKRFGVWGKCPDCKGNGYLFTEEKGHLDLQIWVLHPRKGCSRGVYIKNIQKEELSEVVEFLKSAAKRNAERFSLLGD
jgi:hypothetical protein